MSQISDLSGLRRGHVRLGCGAELLSGFLPTQIAQYRKQFPEVQFTIKADDSNLLNQLEGLNIDLGLSFAPIMPHQSQLVGQCAQPLGILMADNHPLSDRPEIRLHDCLGYPMVMPLEDSPISTLVHLACNRKNISLNSVVVSDSPMLRHQYIGQEQALSFDFPISQQYGSSFHLVPLDKRDAIIGRLSIYKSKGRVLPVAVGKFLDQMLNTINQTFPE